MDDRDVLWTALREAKGVGEKTIHNLWLRMQSSGHSIGDLFALEPPEIERLYSVTTRIAGAIAEQKARLDDVRHEVEALREKGVAILTFDDDRYPLHLLERIGTDSPPVLHARGNLDLLGRNSVSVVGSRNATGRGLEIAIALGCGLAARDIVVVSGGARGIDESAHRGALEGGGSTVVVLSSGINRARQPRAIGEMADEGAMLYLSELPPNASWNAGHAMRRNRIVCGLAARLIVVEAGETGGTVDAAARARANNVPVYVVDVEDDHVLPAGNRRILKAGARRLAVRRDEGSGGWQCDLEALMETNGDDGAGSHPPEQLDLFSDR